MRRYLLALVVVAACERAHPPREETTAHYVWYSPRVGDAYTFTSHGVSSITGDGVDIKREYFRDMRKATLEVENERKVKERVEITRDDHTPTALSLVGIFELVGDPITSIRRLDGELLPEHRKDLMDGRGDCSPTGGHLVAERVYRVGEKVVVPDAEAKCMGFNRAMPDSLEMTLGSVDGATVVFEYAVDYATRDGEREAHDTGTITVSGARMVRTNNVLMTVGTRTMSSHSEGTIVFTRGPEK